MASFPTMRADLLQPAKRVADYDVLPAERGNGEVITLGERSAAQVGGEQEVGPRRQAQVRLEDVSGSSGGSFMDVIRRQGLRRTREPVLLVLPGGDVPIVGRADEGASVARNELGHDGARQPLESNEAPLAVGVVRSPGGVADHVALAVENVEGLVENDPILGEAERG